MEISLSNIGVDCYTVDVVAGGDYYPFGMVMPGRNEQAGDSYRWGFQGQEMDDEVKGKGNSINYKYRMHDPRVGRFFAVDPLASVFPMLTPYQFASNTPVMADELEGLEARVKINKNSDGKMESINLTLSIDIREKATDVSKEKMGVYADELNKKMTQLLDGKTIRFRGKKVTLNFELKETDDATIKLDFVNDVKVQGKDGRLKEIDDPGNTEGGRGKLFNSQVNTVKVEVGQVEAQKGNPDAPIVDMTKEDVATVATHELGHVLGRRHGFRRDEGNNLMRRRHGFGHRTNEDRNNSELTNRQIKRMVKRVLRQQSKEKKT